MQGYLYQTPILGLKSWKSQDLMYWVGEAKSRKIANLGFPSTFMLRDRKKQNETCIPWVQIGKSINFFGSISSNKCAS